MTIKNNLVTLKAEDIKRDGLNSGELFELEESLWLSGYDLFVDA
jgi:hypothetical protein